MCKATVDLTENLREITDTAWKHLSRHVRVDCSVVSLGASVIPRNGFERFFGPTPNPPHRLNLKEIRRFTKTALQIIRMSEPKPTLPRIETPRYCPGHFVAELYYRSLRYFAKLRCGRNSISKELFFCLALERFRRCLLENTQAHLATYYRTEFLRIA